MREGVAMWVEDPNLWDTPVRIGGRIGTPILMAVPDYPPEIGWPLLLVAVSAVCYWFGRRSWVMFRPR